MTDDLLVNGAARLEIGLGGGKRRKRFGTVSLSPSNIGAGHLADIKPVFGRAELLVSTPSRRSRAGGR